MEGLAAGRPSSLRRCCSTPTLHSQAIGDDHEDEQPNLQVYVAARPFRELGGAIIQRLPENFKEFALQIGVGHFMTVFRTRDGALHQFDFGPAGGRDIHTNGGPLSWIVNQEQIEHGQESKQHSGEIRERKLSELPTASIHVGSSQLRLEDIRDFNGTQCTNYELHKNDCRHYVNKVVHFSTGVDGASTQLVREAFGRRQGDLPCISSALVRLLQCVTDTSNWSKVRATGNAACAAMLCLVSSSTVNRVQSIVARRSMVSVSQHPARRAAVAAVASATASCTEVPIMQRAMMISSAVGDRAHKIKRGAATAIGNVGKSVMVTVRVCRSQLPFTSRGPIVWTSFARKGAAGLMALSLRRGTRGWPAPFAPVATHQQLPRRVRQSSAIN